jgi:hypothetical protein
VRGFFHRLKRFAGRDEDAEEAELAFSFCCICFQFEPTDVAPALVGFAVRRLLSREGIESNSPQFIYLLFILFC